MLALMSPWIVGFLVFIALPARDERRTCRSRTTTCSNPPRWIGTANYRYMFGADKQIWPAIRNTLWIIVVGVPLQVLFAFGIAVMLTRARQGAGFFRTVFYLPALAPPVAAALGFVYLLNPATGPVNTLLEQARHQRAALVQRSRRGRSRRSCCSRCGGSATRW